MATELKVWGQGNSGLWSVDGTVDIPHGFVEVPTGDHYLTRKIKELSDLVYLRMKKSKKQRFSRTIGIIAPKAAVEQARSLARKTEEVCLLASLVSWPSTEERTTVGQTGTAMRSSCGFA